jgi:diacylglycerol kinase (ATP)
MSCQRHRFVISTQQKRVIAVDLEGRGIVGRHLAAAPLIIIYNPVAGRRRAQLLWRVLDVMVANGLRLELAETGRPGHAEVLARAAVRSGTKLVVAAGGDGTIAEVAAGISGSGARLGIIPLGTANVIANELGLQRTPRAIAAALAFGRTRRLQPGIITDTDGRSRVFLQMMGVGFDAHVVERVSVPLKRAIGKGAYVAQVIRELPRYRFAPIVVRIDGVQHTASSVIVAKGHYYGGGFVLAPDAKPDTAGFSVVTFGWNGPGAVLMYGAALPLQMLPRAPGVTIHQARTVTFKGGGLLPAQCDGDAAGLIPAAVTDAPHPIDVIIG